MHRRWPILLLTLVALLLAGCAQAARQVPGPGAESARLEPDWAIAEDETPRAVVLAVHGFNDHSGSFEVMAEALAPRGIATYAYDQRGFGLTYQRRIWPGHGRLVEDAALLTRLLAGRYPGTPVYLVGKSMGAAVVLLTLADDPPPVAGSEIGRAHV